MVNRRLRLNKFLLVFATAPFLAQASPVDDLGEALQTAIAKQSCPRTATYAWRNRYLALSAELRAGMKKLNQLYPIDGSEGIPGFLLYGAEFITDNSEMVSDVPAILASQSTLRTSDNWTLAYLLQARSWELGLFLSLEAGLGDPSHPLIPRHPDGLPGLNFVNDPDFTNQVVAALPKVGRLQELLQSYADQNATVNGMFPREVYAYLVPRSLELSSPMTEWLLQQPKGSVSLAQAFEQAMTFYQDPHLAVSVISYLLWLDNAAVASRKRTAVLTSKFQPLLAGDRDSNGSMYHFWGYLRRTISGDNDFKLWALSYGHEVIGQGDHFEHQADDLGIDLGKRALHDLLVCKTAQ